MGLEDYAVDKIRVLENQLKSAEQKYDALVAFLASGDIVKKIDVVFDPKCDVGKKVEKLVLRLYSGMQTHDFVLQEGGLAHLAKSRIN